MMSREELEDLMELVVAKMTDVTSEHVEDSVRYRALFDDFMLKYGKL